MSQVNKHEANNFAKFIFNAASEDVKTTLETIGHKVSDSQIMHLYDAYCSGYFFLFTITALDKYGESVNEQIEETFVDTSMLLVIPSGHLAVGSMFVEHYTKLRDEWMNEDPLSNPVLYTNKLVNDEFNIQSIETVSSCYSRFQSKLDNAFNVT